jgi:hypothetical protein
MHTDQVSDQRHYKHDDKDGRDDRHLDSHCLVGPTDGPRDQAAAECEAYAEKGDGSDKASSDADDIHGTMGGNARDDGEILSRIGQPAIGGPEQDAGEQLAEGKSMAEAAGNVRLRVKKITLSVAGGP